mmetsp:Transcript_45095/g.109111  ORF Transcript_45095/g.109111 Transcript_45095/m.109111 type:complete len:85 (+) Transcript_45095:514-768(+)
MRLSSNDVHPTHAMLRYAICYYLSHHHHHHHHHHRAPQELAHNALATPNSKLESNPFGPSGFNFPNISVIHIQNLLQEALNNKP